MSGGCRLQAPPPMVWSPWVTAPNRWFQSHGAQCDTCARLCNWSCAKWCRCPSEMGSSVSWVAFDEVSPSPNHPTGGRGYRMIHMGSSLEPHVHWVENAYVEIACRNLVRHILMNNCPTDEVETTMRPSWRPTPPHTSGGGGQPQPFTGAGGAYQPPIIYNVIIP